MDVLLVDDEESLLEQAKIFLEEENESIEVKGVPSPDEGLDELEEKEYDIIVSDFQMPGMNGLDFLEKVRKENESRIPFLMFTGKGREEVAMEALNLGADRYLQKGTNPKAQYSVLAQAIEQEVEHKRAQEKIESLARYPSENPEPVLRISREGEILYSNEAGKSLLSKWGIEKGNKVPENWRDLIKKTFKKDESKEEKLELEEKYYSFTITPVQNEDYANMYGKDVTELVKAKKQLENK